MSNEHSDIRTWLARRLSVASEQAVSEQLIDAIRQDPRAGLLQLFETLNRKVPSDTKLRQWVADFNRSFEKQPAPPNIADTQRKVEETLKQYGVVQRRFEVEEAERLLVCVRQFHGWLSELAMHVGKPEKRDNLRQWFLHQNELVAIQHSLDKTIGEMRCRFFLETLQNDSAVFSNAFLSPDIRKTVRENEQDYIEAAWNWQKTERFFIEILKCPIHQQNDLLISATGMRRYVNLLATQEPVSKMRFLGLEYPGRLNYFQQLQATKSTSSTSEIERRKGLRKKDAVDLNASIQQKVNAHLNVGECGVLLLGSGHFDTEEEYAAKNSKYLDYDPELPMHRVDRHMRETGCLGKTNILVFQPNTLNDKLDLRLLKQGD